jgi:argininosuccinate lyase
MRKKCAAIDEDVFSVLKVESSVERRDIPGGTAGSQDARDWLAEVSPD